MIMVMLIIFLQIFVTVTCMDCVKSFPYKVKSDSEEVFLAKYEQLHKTMDNVALDSEKADTKHPLLIVKINGRHSIKGINEDLKLPLLIFKMKNGKDNNVKQIGRQQYDVIAKEEKYKEEKLKRQHYEKMRQIINFMGNHMLTTNYFYEEIQRIMRDRMVKDELREMISYLEKPKNAALKKSVLEYFNSLVDANKQSKSIWDHKPNNLVINVFKDPFNDGVIN